MEISVIDFVKKLEDFRKVSECVYPEQWNFICATHDISVSKAQKMFRDYKYALCGSLPYKDNKVDEEALSVLFALAEETYQFYNLPSSPSSLKVRGFGNEYDLGVKVYWRNKAGELLTVEGNFHHAEIYHQVAKLMEAGMEIVAIVREVDSMSSPDSYIGKDIPDDDDNRG